MLSSKTLALIGIYYTFAFKTHCTPFEWNWGEKKMYLTKSRWNFFTWVFCATLMWTKIIFMSIRLYQSYAYLDVTIEEFVIHYYYWALYSYCGFLQLNGFDMRNWFPLMINRFKTFNETAKHKYFPHIATPGVLLKDNIEGMVINVFVIIGVNSAITFVIFLDSPSSPQFFYSMLPQSFGGFGSLHVQIYFALLEAYLTLISWTTILLWATTSICCSTTLNFWIQQINSHYSVQHLSRPDSKIRTIKETMKMWRNLQLLNTEYNSVCYRMTVGVKVSAFFSHLGTNYGTIRLFNSMKFKVWINCPLVSICGTAVLLQLFKLLSWVNVEALDCLQDLKLKLKDIPPNSSFSRIHARKRLASLKPLMVKGYNFYFFKRSTPVTFQKLLIDNTITVLLL